jgi:hypothetical protein
MARVSSGTNSKQDYKTPKNLIEACEARFGKITVDLAADAHNRVCKAYFCAPETLDNSDGLIGVDSLAYDWAPMTVDCGDFLFSNPPFRKIPEFSSRFKEESVKGAKGLLLIPDDATKAYMGNVIGHADVYRLVGRVPFKVNEDGTKESFPKDCCVAHYYPGNDRPKYVYWNWKRNRIIHSFYLE